ncbi:MAG: hypothetical protein R2750_02995 [Bacteroidales bacterium]
MKNYKPYAYLYINDDEDPQTLISCFIAQIPAGKKLTLRSGDPSTVGSKTTIRYSIEADAGQTQSRKEEFENEFAWDGNTHEVEVIIGSGSGDGGGKNITSSEYAELD